MLIKLAAHSRRPLYAVGLALAMTAGPAPLAAQEIQAIDPNQAINSDLAPPPVRRLLRGLAATEPGAEILRREFGQFALMVEAAGGADRPA